LDFSVTATVTATETAFPSIQRPVLALAIVMTTGVLGYALGLSARQAGLFVIGIALGVALYHASFGFTGSYRRVIVHGDISGVTAQLVMLAAAILLFAPILAQGSAFGHGVGGAIAPVNISLALGAFLFGIGMQLGGGCASGTLFSAGGGNLRMGLVLVFFCLGAFWGSLDLAWWSRLPGIGEVSLAGVFGWEIALPMQLGALVLIYLGLRIAGARNKRPIWWAHGFSWMYVLRGPWPLLLSAGLLALLNWAILLLAGHPWSITWGFSLWAAKVALALGWDPATSSFWNDGYAQAALVRPVLADDVSVTNIGIILGALIAASLAAKVSPKPIGSLRSLVAVVVGGLLMGYGARLAYGCNIGSLFSGLASASLHGWVWITCAIPGNVIGVYLRPLFGQSND
jgi:hypothetical protein